MFGRKQVTKDTVPETARTQSEPDETGNGDEIPSGGKGRPTPKRRESEAARRQRLTPPKDRREARARVRAERAKERQRASEALRSGDEKNYPLRDRGQARHIARNWVDGRRNAGELFWPVVIAALVLLFLPIGALQMASTTVLLAFYLFIGIDSAYSLLKLRRRLAQEVPNELERKGALAYAFGRSIQSRRRRLPPPKVEPGWTRRYARGEVKA